LNGVIPAYFVTDLSLRYVLPSTNAAFTLAVKNMFDKRYIASRRPAGIRVGMPRFICAGIDLGI
jgi:Fe(3+) dicitrate transport protein